MQALYIKFIVLMHLYPKEQIVSKNTLLMEEVNVCYSAHSFSIAKGQGQLYQTRLLNIDTQEELYLLFKLYPTSDVPYRSMHFTFLTFVLLCILLVLISACAITPDQFQIMKQSC